MSEKIRLRELPGAVFFVSGHWPIDKFAGKFVNGNAAVFGRLSPLAFDR